MKEKKESTRDIILFAMLLCGIVTLVIFTISSIAWIFLRDPLIISAGSYRYVPSKALARMTCYFLLIIVFFVYVPLRSRIHERTISKKGGIVAVTVLAYFLSCVSLAIFLSLTTQLIDYQALSEENSSAQLLVYSGIPCTFDLKESYFDAVSGFTTTGLTAFKRISINGKEIYKVDAQPELIHVIRATYLWVGGLGIMFFYLYFTPVPSLMMSTWYEMPTERSLPRFVRLEGLSLFFIYVIITFLGIFFLYLSMSSSCPDNPDSALTYSIVLAFSSISTGGFSPGSSPINELGTENCPMVDHSSLVVIMILMLLGAMPIFALHRPMKFLRRWMIFALFLVPIFTVAALSYSEEDPEISLYRSFDALSAFTTTGFSTSQFTEDYRMPSESKYEHRINQEIVREIYLFRIRNVYAIALMFIGGAAYSTAGGWGFFNVFTIIYILYLIVTGKIQTIQISGKKSRRWRNRVFLTLVLSFSIFFLIFSIGTVSLYLSGLFGSFSGPEPAAIADYVVNSAFYEISALSTVGLAPDYLLPDSSIYCNNLAYWTLVISMLVGRIFYILFPFLLYLATPEEVI
jgi:Trk-type K+ transport system membrane component